MYVTTRTLDPGRGRAADALDEPVRRLVPPDYLRLLRTLGAGTYCDEVDVTVPDARILPETYGARTHFWTLDEAFDADDLRAAVQIGRSADGDAFCCTPRHPGVVFILPRHARAVEAFPTFEAALASRVPGVAAPWYDPAYDAVVEIISLATPTGLRDIAPIYDAFRQAFSADFVAREKTQPRHFFQAFGGWVSFDLVYRSSLTVKHQARHQRAAAPVLGFVRRHAAP